MASQRLTIRAAAPKFVLKQAERYRLDREMLLKKSGLTEEELADSDKRISREKLSLLWTEVEELTGNRFFGLSVGAKVKTEQLGLVGYAMRCSETLGDAITKLKTYAPLLADDVELEISTPGDRAIIHLEAAISLVAIRHPIHCRLAILVSVARELTNRNDLSPIEVHVPEEAFDDKEGKLRGFFRCPIEFGAGVASVSFFPNDWNQLLQTHDPQLGKYLNEHATNLIERRLPDADLKQQIEHILSTKLTTGDPGLAGVAEELGMSPRTLQRQLAASKTRYKDVLDEFRREMALSLLNNPKLTIKEVAFLLGYNEASGFYRAFHRWKRCAPNEFRERLQKKKRGKR